MDNSLIEISNQLKEFSGNAGLSGIVKQIHFEQTILGGGLE